MDNKERLSLYLYDIVISIRDTLSLPTHKSLEKTFYFSLGLLLCSLLSELLGFYTFISWQGCLICIGLLLLLLWLERSENDALLRMYRTARLSAQKVVRRRQTSGTSNSTRRVSDKSAGNKRKTSRGVKSNAKGKAR